MDAGFTIRPLTTFAEFRRIATLQQSIWGFSEGEGIYPPLLLSMSQNGGIVLGAFDPAGEIIGFLVGYLARSPGGPLTLYSQTMGIVPEWRSRGVGYALKMEQRRFALASDLPLITWTFDPLRSPNARLNLHKLGAISRTYKRDVYGSDFGTLNAGLPSDRLLVEWWQVEEPAQHARPALQAAAPVIETVADGSDRRPVRVNLDATESVLAIENIRDIFRLKDENQALAQAWRETQRTVFEHYFGRGYVAVDFVTDANGRNYYILERRKAS